LRAPSVIYTLSLHDALPILRAQLVCPPPGDPTPLTSRHVRTLPTREEALERASSQGKSGGDLLSQGASPQVPSALAGLTSVFGIDRKSTRLNSSHLVISYAV